MLVYGNHGIQECSARIVCCFIQEQPMMVGLSKDSRYLIGRISSQIMHANVAYWTCTHAPGEISSSEAFSSMNKVISSSILMLSLFENPCRLDSDCLDYEALASSTFCDMMQPPQLTHPVSSSFHNQRSQQVIIIGKRINLLPSFRRALQ